MTYVLDRDGEKAFVGTARALEMSLSFWLAEERSCVRAGLPISAVLARDSACAVRARLATALGHPAPDAWDPPSPAFVAGVP